MDAEAIALDAFRLMKENKVTGAPVVDHHGNFVAHLSVKDLKLVSEQTLLELLYKNTVQFVGAAHNEETNIPAPIIYVK